MQADDRSLVTGQGGLCAAFGAFYADLFSASPVDAAAQAELLSHLLSPLPSASRYACEGSLSMEDCFVALQGMLVARLQVVTVSLWSFTCVFGVFLVLTL